MANVLHRTTKQYLTSVNDPLYPTQDWIHNPDLSLVAGEPPKYWVIAGDLVTLMTAPQQAIVDAAELEAQKDAVADNFDRVMTVMRAFAEVVVDEFNGHSDKINAILDAADGANSLGQFKTAMLAITDRPQRNLSQLKTAVRNKL